MTRLRRRLAEAERDGRVDGRHVFTTNSGGPCDETKIRKAMLRVCKAAGLDRYSPHDLRHTYASLLLQDGKSPAYVQRQLGHASIQQTVDTYGRWLPSASQENAARLDEISPVWPVKLRVVDKR